MARSHSRDRAMLNEIRCMVLGADQRFNVASKVSAICW